MKIDFNKLWKEIKDHSGTICAVGAIFGVGATAYFSGRGAIKVHEELEPEMEKKEKAKVIAKAHWKTGVSFAATTGLIIASDSSHVRKEIGLAGLAFMYKDKIAEFEEKIKEKFGEESLGEMKQEMAEDDLRKAYDSTDFEDIKLSSEEFIVYVPSAEQFYITTEKRIFYALYKTNEELHKLKDVRLSYFCRKLGKSVPVKDEYTGKMKTVYNPYLDDIGWRLDNAQQHYEWEMFGGPWIDYVRDVYIRKAQLDSGKVTIANYLNAGEQVKSTDIRALFFTVEPERQRFEDRM